jgi:shikimate dehydrogenase
VENLKDALAGMRALGNFRGMSITIPHKIAAMQFVDEVDPADQAIGSINTVINENGKLKGLGTDGPGALKALVEGDADPSGKSVLMIGAGGAARAIAFTLALKTPLAGLHLLDVDQALLGQLTRDLSSGTPVHASSAVLTDRSLAGAMEKADIIIHCTPVGMHPKENASLVPPSLFQPHQAVFDIVYNPLETKLLKDAKEKGLKTVSGVDMFIHQAVLQFEKFTNKKAPVHIMRQVVMEKLVK